MFDSNRPGGYGERDIYIAYRKTDDTWTKPFNLGDKINSRYSECRAYVSPDGKYLFYTSSRTGNMDAFWADARIIDELKPDELKLKNK